MKIHDVTLPISETTPVFPGDPPVRIEPLAAPENGAGCRTSLLHLSSHTGTHIDPPYHLFEKGVKLDCVPLDLLCGEARVVASPARERITKRELQKQNWRGVKRVLFKTRNSRLWGSVGFREDFVHLAEDAAQFLVERGISLVGIDGLSVDRLSSSNLDVHRTFLERGVMIVEGLDLSEPPAGNYELLALPLKILNSDGAPARVILRR